MKGTLVRQAEGSTYTLTEAAVGGAIARHDVSVAQVGLDLVKRVFRVWEGVPGV